MSLSMNLGTKSLKSNNFDRSSRPATGGLVSHKVRNIGVMIKISKLDLYRVLVSRSSERREG